eukprot:161428-Hanusia_phi.AAC.4
MRRRVEGGKKGRKRSIQKSKERRRGGEEKCREKAEKGRREQETEPPGRNLLPFSFVAGRYWEAKEEACSPSDSRGPANSRCLLEVVHADRVHVARRARACDLSARPLVADAVGVHIVGAELGSRQAVSGAQSRHLVRRAGDGEVSRVDGVGGGGDKCVWDQLVRAVGVV